MRRGPFDGTSLARYLSRRGERLAERLPELYLAFVGLGLVPFLFLQAPFQTSDAFSQFARAVELVRGQIDPAVITPHGAGVILPVSVIKFFYLFWGLLLQRGVAHVTSGQLARANSLHWTSQVAFMPSNTSPLWPNGSGIYSPFTYLPQMVALEVARLFNLSLLVAYYLVCGLNGAFAAGLSYAALRVARFGRPLMFGVLILPMTLSIYFSVSQDASVIALGALLFALVSYHIARPPTSLASYRYAITWLAVLGYLFSVNRPTNLPIFLVLFLIPRPTSPASISIGPGEPRFSFWRTRRLPGLWWPLVVGGVLAAGAAITFLIALGHGSASVSEPGASIHRQLLSQLEHPGPALGVVVRSIVDEGRNWMETFFGQLGWNGGGPFLGRWAYLALGVGLVGLALAGGGVTGPGTTEAGVATTTSSKMRDGLWMPATLVLLVLITLMTMEVLYLSWSPVGYPLMTGIQGRYFLPVAFFAALALVPRGWAWGRRLTAPFVVTFSLAFLGVTIECTFLLLNFFWVSR